MNTIIKFLNGNTGNIFYSLMLTLFFMLVGHPGSLQAQVFSGNLTLNTQAQIDAFNYTDVTGILTIQESVSGNIVDLTPLSSLTSVGFLLIIRDNTALTSLDGLQNLTATSSVTIRNNDALTSLNDLLDSQTLNGLTIWGNNALTSLDGLQHLTISSIFIRDNAALTSLDGLQNLTATSSVTIVNNDALTSLNALQGLTELSYLDISGNDALTSLNGLQNLTRIGSYMGFYDNDALTSLEGLQGGPARMTGILEIADNDVLLNLKGLENITFPESIDIYDNAALINLEGLEGLTGVFFDIEIYNNAALRNLDGLQNLTEVEDIFLYDNDALTSLDALQGVTVMEGFIEIGDNDVLVNLHGLQNLTQLDAIYIYNSPALTSLGALQNLTTVTGILQLWGNDVLRNLDGLQNLEQVYRLEILYNAALTNLDGLQSLTEVLNRFRSVYIINNVALSRFCGLYSLFSEGSVGGPVTISGNSANPTVAEILAAGPCTAEDRILTLSEQIEDLVAGEVLNQGQGQGLNNKLVSATKKLEQGNTAAALAKMQAFIDQVTNFVNDGVLSPAEAQPLLDAASGIIDFINNPLAKQGAEGEIPVLDGALPVEFALAQNYPNPFNPSTTIRFSLPEAAQVQLTVYDINGREVRQLVSGSLADGAYDIQWDATGNNGTAVASGIYIYRLQAGAFIQTRKMTLLK